MENNTAVEWLGGEILTVLTEREEIILIDPIEMKILETIEVRSAGLVYHDYFFHPDSKSSEPSVHNSLRVTSSSLFLLGNEKIFSPRINTWNDRIELLIQQGQWLEALTLALDFYEGIARVAIGLPRDQTTLRNKLKDRILELLMQYVQIAITPKENSSSSNTIDQQYLRIVGGTAIEYCLTIQQIDYLLIEIYSKFVFIGEGQLLLELLEPYILNQKISYLTPQVTHDLCTLTIKQQRLNVFEQCVLHLDVTRLDIEMLIPLLRQYYLLSGMIYCYNQALNDYITPIDSTMSLLLSEKFPKDQHSSLSSRLLLYFYYCIDGKIFPTGSKQTQRNNNWIIGEILKGLFREELTVTDYNSTVIPPYPYINHFLTFHIQHFFEILKKVFNATGWEQEFRKEDEQREELINRQGKQVTRLTF